MKIKNQIGLALSLVLLSTSVATAQPKPTDSPNPTISTQQREELENYIKRNRYTITSNLK